MTEKKNANLPAIQTLFQDSWELFQRTFLSYLKLLGLGIAFLFLGVLIGILISLPVTVITIGNHFQIFHHITPFYTTILVLLGLWAVLYLLSILAMGVIFPIVSILIFQEEKAESLFDLIKQSKQLFWPYFLTMLLSGVLVFGGMALLVIPGIVIAIFFSFVAYEVVLENQSGSHALQRSYVMVKHYFWQVVGRLV